MKIGVLTYHRVCNFGANLQTLSTVSFLKKMGHSPVVIDLLNEQLEAIEKSKVPKCQYDVHMDFCNTCLPLTKRCYNENDVVDVIESDSIEAVIIGSDAVMQHHPLLSRIVFPTRTFFYISKKTPDKMFPNPFWGTFFTKLKETLPMAMMSGSSQNSPYRGMSATTRKKCYEALTHFTFLSVRDDWTRDMVKWISNDAIIPKVTPDPVFAFNENVSSKMIPSEEEIRRKYDLQNPYYLISFFNYSTVNREWIRDFKENAKNKGIDCVALTFPFGITFSDVLEKKIITPLPPLDWYALIKYSSGYIGHNMHPVIVCLTNHVPFFSFDTYGITKLHFYVNEKSSKIYHILNEFGLLENRVSCLSKRYSTLSPSYIIEKLDNFPKAEVAKMASLYVENYNKMMEDIIKSFSKI